METTPNKGGRMNAAQRDYKKSVGKDLYIKGFALTNIAEMIGITIKTLSKWRDEENWNREKELHAIRPSEIKKMILQYVLDLKEGKTPQYKALDLANISSAFDRLNDSRKKVVYSMEAFDMFASYMFQEAAGQTGKKRDEYIKLIQTIRPFMDAFINLLLETDD